MTVETFLTHRKALYKGEDGLFAANEMAAEDLAIFALNSELMAKLWSEKKLERLKYLWALVHKTSDNCDLFIDKDDAMRGLKIRVGYSKAVYDTLTKKIEVKPKSLTRISDGQLSLLTARIQDVITREILPGITVATLRKEIEDLIGQSGQAA